MPITRYEGKTFHNQVFVLEECWFINCVLRNCDLFYSGGDFRCDATRFENCTFRWCGAADKTIRLLRLFGMLKQEETPVSASPSSGPVN